MLQWIDNSIISDSPREGKVGLNEFLSLPFLWLLFPGFNFWKTQNMFDSYIIQYYQQEQWGLAMELRSVI